MNKYAQRVAALRRMMEEKGWDAVILTGSDPHASEYPAARWKQVEWLSGFTGEAGDLVITADHAGLWTDTRYFIQAERQLSGTGIALHKLRIPGEVPIPRWLAEAAFPDSDRNVVVAVDGSSHALSSIRALADAFGAAGQGADRLKIVDVPDVLEPFWGDRPPVPVSPVITLGADIVGESREDKILWLRNFLIDNDCDAMLLTALDEIAWLLNVRGSDVEYNPVVISYLLVTLDEVCWFVHPHPSAESDADTCDTFYELAEDDVRVRPYDEVGIGLAERIGDGSVRRLYIDPSTLNYHLYKLLETSVPEGADPLAEDLSDTGGEAGESLAFGPSPVALRKALKNEVEIAGMREAHREDGLAMERFLYWLDRQMEMGEWLTEGDAADRLGALRAQIPGYRGDSFATISAYGPDAALPHYVTPPHGGARLQPHGLYLCDSGGQYLFGTTDITRTVPLGPCSDLEREDYTLVLKGHIGLARAVFPMGTAGCQLDILARHPLWYSKRNFGHGTGHGIGFFLNVHEGPQDIRQNFNPQPLLPGMITSDEPGIYREGRHGVRHESLLLCVEAGANDFGHWLRFENLTRCHIDTGPVIRDLLTPEERAWLNDYNETVWRDLSPRLPKEIAGWLREKTRPI